MPPERMCAVPDLPPLNARQAAFVREYLASWDARSAAEDAGISLMQSPPASGYYVYILINPESGVIIYVGKGKGRRMFAHVPNSKRTSAPITNAKKTRAIHDLIMSGVTPQAFAVFHMQSERDAYIVEKQMIAGIGLDNLTNFSSGATTQADRCLVRVQMLLDRMKPKDDWLRTNPRMWAGAPPADEFYDSYVGAMHQMIYGYNEVIAGRGVMMGAEPLYHRPWPGLNNNGENQNG